MLSLVKCALVAGKNTIKSNLRILVGFAISGLFLLAILWSVDIQQTKEALGSANYAYIPVAVLLSLVTNVLRSYRWKYVLNPIRHISIGSLFSGVAIGYMANNLLPARLGELVRSYVIGKKEDISKSSILATIVVERLFDGFTLLLFLVLVSVFFTIPFWIKQVGLVAAICLSSFSAFLVLLLAKRKTWVSPGSAERGASVFSVGRKGEFSVGVISPRARDSESYKGHVAGVCLFDSLLDS